MGRLIAWLRTWMGKQRYSNDQTTQPVLPEKRVVGKVVVPEFRMKEWDELTPKQQAEFAAMGAPVPSKPPIPFDDYYDSPYAPPRPRPKRRSRRRGSGGHGNSGGVSSPGIDDGYSGYDYSGGSSSGSDSGSSSGGGE